MTPSSSYADAPSAHGALQTARFRVYADQDFRRGLRWKERVDRQFDHISGVAARLGARVEVVDRRDWDRQTDSGAMVDTLAELEQLDGGDDVDWVVGFVTALPTMSASMHHLGVARLYGKHFLVRAMDSMEEHEHFIGGLTAIPEDERETVYRQRKLHKEVSVFLHEWGHTLGAIHVRESTRFMFPAHGHRQQGFAPANEALIRIGLRRCLGKGKLSHELTAKWQEEAATYIKENPWDGWDTVARKQTLAALGVGSGEQASPRTRTLLLPKEEIEAYNEAVRLSNNGAQQQAWAILLPLLQSHRDVALVQELGCHVAVLHEPAAVESRELCDHAASLPGASAAPMVALARLLHRDGSLQAALPMLARAEAKLLADPSAEASLWSVIAGIYQQASLVSLCESAATRAGDTPQARSLLIWSRRTRMRAALPKNARDYGITPELEGQYIGDLRAVHAELQTGRIKSAATMAAAARNKYPGAPGPEVILCQVHLQRGRRAKARRACDRALAIYPEASLALHLVSLIDVAEGRLEQAVGGFRQVIELDEEFENAWQQLADLYRTRGNGLALKNLQKKYQEQFGRSLR